MTHELAAVVVVSASLPADDRGVEAKVVPVVVARALEREAAPPALAELAQLSDALLIQPAPGQTTSPHEWSTTRQHRTKERAKEEMTTHMK